MAKKKKWIKPRHKIIQAIAKMILWPVCKIKYGITIEKFKEQEDRPYLILYNHQPAFDQFFIPYLTAIGFATSGLVTLIDFWSS